MMRKEPLGFTITHTFLSNIIQFSRFGSIQSVYIFLPDLFTQHCEIHPLGCDAGTILLHFHP